MSNYFAPVRKAAHHNDCAMKTEPIPAGIAPAAPVPSMRTPVRTAIRAAEEVNSRSGKNENTFEGNETGRQPPRKGILKINSEIVLLQPLAGKNPEISK